MTRLLVALIAILLAPIATSRSAVTVLADDGRASAVKVKAAMVVAFMKYVTWPKTRFATPDSPLVIGVVGEKFTYEKVRLAAKSKKIQGRKIVVKRLGSAPAGDKTEWSSCHVIFVPDSAAASVKDVIAFSAKKNVLTVSDHKGFAKKGGAIEFVVVKKKMKLRANTGATKAAEIKLSSKLLSLAIKESRK